eukprot:1161059-Pelagomonas_calceolata.AAC.12
MRWPHHRMKARRALRADGGGAVVAPCASPRRPLPRNLALAAAAAAHYPCWAGGRRKAARTHWLPHRMRGRRHTRAADAAAAEVLSGGRGVPAGAPAGLAEGDGGAGRGGSGGGGITAGGLAEGDGAAVGGGVTAGARMGCVPACRGNRVPGCMPLH